jgi:SAM-dependent methyltransferase
MLFVQLIDSSNYVVFAHLSHLYRSNTRYKPWPRVAEFLANTCSAATTAEITADTAVTAAAAATALVADVGCGNGKYLQCIPSHVHMIGSDTSVPLLRDSANKVHTLLHYILLYST